MANSNVRPTASFDHLVDAEQERLRDRQPERLGGRCLPGGLCCNLTFPFLAAVRRRPAPSALRNVKSRTPAQFGGRYTGLEGESPLEGILSYLWKSRYRLLMNRSYRPQSHRRKHRLLLSRSPSQCGSEGRTLMSPGENRIARHLKHDGFRVGEIIAYRAWR